MGNNPSSQSQAQSQAQPPAVPSNNAVRREPKRRGSIQALQSVKANPTAQASLESATAQAGSLTSSHTASSHSHSHARSYSQSHARSRSHTSSAFTSPMAAPLFSHHDSSTPIQNNNTNSPASSPVVGSHLSRRIAIQPTTKPVDVPATASEKPAAEPSPAGVIAPSSDQYTLPPFSRPPRLPLPIEQEVHTPGSPIISPDDLASSPIIEVADLDGIIPRRSSVLSSTTVDDEDLGDELQSESPLPAVPTLIEWRQGGDRVYVTGTFAGWDRKVRLYEDGPSPHKDALSATLHLVPGTHHLKFIVDGDMQLSQYLPTAVDFTNILVNYIEVSPDDLPHPPADAAEESDAAPEPTPIAEKPAGLGESIQEQQPAQDVSPAAPTAPAQTPMPEAPKIITAAALPPKRYHSNIPRFLLDIEAPEESSKFVRAMNVINELPAPPSLPGMLNKSILNGTTPKKDDSSVLNLPNHTVLNHLATSSIKNNVLATSATTRYIKKFLTTIMYKPTNDAGD